MLARHRHQWARRAVAPALVRAAAVVALLVDAAAIAPAFGCAARAGALTEIDEPVSDHVELRLTGAPEWEVDAAREPGATVLTVRSETPCEVDLVRVVDRTVVRARRAPGATAPLLFGGAGGVGLGLGLLGIPLSRPEPGADAGFVAAGATLVAAGGLALGAGAALAWTGRDRVERRGRAEVRTKSASRCGTPLVAPVRVALVDAAGGKVREGTTDTDGRWRVADADSAGAVSLMVEGVVAGPAVGALRCDAATRAELDAFAAIVRERTAALASVTGAYLGWDETARDVMGAAAGAAAGAAEGAAEEAVAGARPLHALAVARGAVHLEAPGVTSEVAIPLVAPARERGLVVVARASPAGGSRPWPVRVAAPGCHLLIVLQAR